MSDVPATYLHTIAHCSWCETLYEQGKAAGRQEALDALEVPGEMTRRGAIARVRHLIPGAPRPATPSERDKLRAEVERLRAVAVAASALHIWVTTHGHIGNHGHNREGTACVECRVLNAVEESLADLGEDSDARPATPSEREVSDTNDTKKENDDGSRRIHEGRSDGNGGGGVGAVRRALQSEEGRVPGAPERYLAVSLSREEGGPERKDVGDRPSDALPPPKDLYGTECPHAEVCNGCTSRADVEALLQRTRKDLYKTLHDVNGKLGNLTARVRLAEHVVEAARAEVTPIRMQTDFPELFRWLGIFERGNVPTSVDEPRPTEAKPVGEGRPYGEQSAEWRAGYDEADQVYHAQQRDLRRQLRNARAVSLATPQKRKP